MEKEMSDIKKIMRLNHIDLIKKGKLFPSKEKLGEGDQATVYKGRYDGHQVAVKHITKYDERCLMNEIYIMWKLNKFNLSIPKFYGVVLDKEENEVELVTEFIPGKTLNEFDPNQFSNELKYKLIKELAELLVFLHSNSCIHRDIKPENLILHSENNNLYLIDFGIAKVCIKGSLETRLKGNFYYLAPECFDNDVTDGQNEIITKITAMVDVWAYGCFVSWLFSGIKPWCAKYQNQASLIRQCLVLKKPYPIPAITDEVIVQVIKLATAIDPTERATMQAILDNLNSS